MKTKWILMMAFLMTGMTILAADKHEAPIKQVTVFTNGAQVERSQSLNLTAGASTEGSEGEGEGSRRPGTPTEGTA